MWVKYTEQKKGEPGGFPGGPVVKNLPSNVGDTGSIPGQGTEAPHAPGQPAHHNQREAHTLQLRPDAAKKYFF